MYELRCARDSERGQIARLWHESASLPDVGPARMPTFDDLRARVDKETAGGWLVTVAVLADRIIGFVAIRPEENVLAELFVSPAHLGQGIGKQLLDRAKQAMPAGFTLFTTARNARARHFYTREGLVVAREGLHPRAGHPVVYFRWFGR